MHDPHVVGWDVGGAHVKAALLRHGELVDAQQWPCRLWTGLDALRSVLELAQERWPAMSRQGHAVTMSGEMADCFAHREAGVAGITGLLQQQLPEPRFFAGDAGWCNAEAATAHWNDVASANWLATARHVAQQHDGQAGLLVDIGSTTTDFTAFRRGRLVGSSRGDADRLASGELLYLGVARTPLCALTQRVGWRGRELNVMNEFFATTADVYRLTGELDAEHDQHPSADGAAKDLPATRARLARMIGHDARDGSPAEWLAFAQAWRAVQVARWRAECERVAERHAVFGPALAVAAGCGAFVVPEIVPAGWRVARYGRDVARATDAALAAWADVCAPAVAVAALFEQEQR